MFKLSVGNLQKSRQFLPFSRLQGYIQDKRVIYNEVKRFSTQDSNESSFGIKLALKLNQAFSDYPRYSFGGMFALEMVSLYGTYSILVSAPMQSVANFISLDFALAFALSRPLRRFRFPLDLGATVILSKFFPSLKLIQVSKLFNSIFPLPEFKTGGFLHKASSKLNGLLDKYGSAYFIGARYSGIAVILGLWYFIYSGFDVKKWLSDHFDIGTDTLNKFGDFFGVWAASVTFAGVLYPFTLFGGGLLGSKLGRFMKTRRA